MRYTLGNIFLRLIFFCINANFQDVYSDKICEGMNLKILLDECHNHKVNKLVKWMRGAFDALEMRYVSK